MAGTNDFLPFGLSAGLNVLTQSDYAALPARTAGFSTGTANSPELNKVWRQSAFVASCLGTIISNANLNAIDDGNATNFINNFLAALFTSPALTGAPTAPTAAGGDNSTKLATTAFVQTAISTLASVAYVNGQIATRAPLASPNLSGTPTTPTAAVGTNTNQIASTAFVQNSLASYLTTAAAANIYATIQSLSAYYTAAQCEAIFEHKVADWAGAYYPATVIANAVNGSVLNFGGVLFQRNMSGIYNPFTGAFTVPGQGLYQINAAVAIQANTSSLFYNAFAINIDGVDIVSASIINYSNGVEQSTANLIVPLNPGSQIKLIWRGASMSSSFAIPADQRSYFNVAPVRALTN